MKNPDIHTLIASMGLFLLAAAPIHASGQSFDFDQESSTPPAGWKNSPKDHWSIRSVGGKNAYCLDFPGLIETAGGAATTLIEQVAGRNFVITSEFSLNPGPTGTSYWGVGLLAEGELFSNEQNVPQGSFYLVDLGFVLGQQVPMARIVRFDQTGTASILASEPLSGIDFKPGVRYHLTVNGNYDDGNLTLSATVAEGNTASQPLVATDANPFHGDYFGIRCFPDKTEDFESAVFSFEVRSLTP